MRKNLFDENTPLPDVGKQVIPKSTEKSTPELCPTCWTRLSLLLVAEGEYQWWCMRCSTAGLSVK